MMKKFCIVIIVLTFVQLGISQSDYLGQTPPGDSPEIFAPGIIQGYVHGKIAISPGGDEIFWVVKPSTERIYTSRFTGGTWSTPSLAPFVNGYTSVFNGDPVFSMDGSRLFFYSNRAGGLGGFDVWFVEKTETGWSQASPLGESYNTPDFDPTPIFTNAGKAYRFDYNNKNFCYTYFEHLFSNPESVETLPDYGPWWSIFISPEEDYLIFSGGEDNADLFIRFKNEANAWSDPIPMGDPINTPDDWERFPVVSPDGKYLFFIRGNDRISRLYWVSADVIDSLKSSISGLEEEKTSLPCHFILHQNYPNPFNPTTQIQYSLAKSSHVNLSIYNMLGQKVRTLANFAQNAGTYSLAWDATDDYNHSVSAGIYLYSLKTDDRILQKKMLLVQ